MDNNYSGAVLLARVGLPSFDMAVVQRVKDGKPLGPPIQIRLPSSALKKFQEIK